MICVVRLGIHREERDDNVTGDTAVPAFYGIRRLTGLSARGYGRTHESIRHSQELNGLHRKETIEE